VSQPTTPLRAQGILQDKDYLYSNNRYYFFTNPADVMIAWMAFKTLEKITLGRIFGKEIGWMVDEGIGSNSSSRPARRTFRNFQVPSSSC
jgi:hypothetical protein